VVYSPFRSAISHAPRNAKPKAGEPFVSYRPGGSRLPHGDAKLNEVRRLVETTLMSYREISQRAGVAETNIRRWTNDCGWQRPLFAPRSTDTVPTWRAGKRRRRRMLAARLDALAERHIRELEAAPAIDAAKLREALELLKMAKLAERPYQGPHRAPKTVLADPQARARVIADLRANGVDIARAPGEALADFVESCAPGPKPKPDPALRERGRYSKRNKHHAWMLERE
jgi:glycine/D-amino acid oxidase-like deaminating enzyme